MGQVGLEWTVAGFGDFSGNANETDMLMRNSNTGAFEVYDISHNAITSAASMGQVGLEWTVAGFGDFSGNANETDMLMRNSNTGAFEVYDISHNAITSAAVHGPGRLGVAGRRHCRRSAAAAALGRFDRSARAGDGVIWRERGRHQRAGRRPRRSRHAAANASDDAAAHVRSAWRARLFGPKRPACTGSFTTPPCYE